MASHYKIQYKSYSGKELIFDSSEQIKEYLIANPKEFVRFILDNDNFHEEFDKIINSKIESLIVIDKRLDHKNILTLNGWGATNSLENLTINNHLKAGNTVYFERQTADSDIIVAVAYFRVNEDGRVIGEAETIGLEDAIDTRKPGSNLKRIVLQNKLFESDKWVKVKEELLSKISIGTKSKGQKRVGAITLKSPLLMGLSKSRIRTSSIGKSGYKLNYNTINDVYELYQGNTLIQSIPYNFNQQSIIDDITKILLDRDVKESVITNYFSNKNRHKLSRRLVEELLLDMHVIGQPFNSNITGVLQINKKAKIGTVVEINEIISNIKQKYLKKYGNTNNFNESTLLQILTKPSWVGKVFTFIDNEIIPFRTLKPSELSDYDYKLQQQLNELSAKDHGQSLLININNDLSEPVIVAKRDGKIDYKNTKIPNVRGRIINIYKAGVNTKKELNGADFYTISWQPDDKGTVKSGKGELGIIIKEGLTFQEALNLLREIRIDINYKDLEFFKDIKKSIDEHKEVDKVKLHEYNKFIDHLTNVLRFESEPNTHFGVLHNLIEIGIDNNDISSTNDSQIIEDSNEIDTVEDLEDKGINLDNPEQNEETPKTTDENKSNVIEISTNEKNGIKKYTELINKSKRKINKDIFKISDNNYVGKVEEAVKFLKERFEELQINVDDTLLSNLVKGSIAEGSKVWGAFHNAMVTLSSNAGVKIAKHEAMHIAFKMLLSPAQQIKILRELWAIHKDSPKYKNKEAQFKEELENFHKSNLDTATNLKTNAEAFYAQLPLLDQLQEELSDTYEDYKIGLLISKDSKFYNKFPNIANWLNKLFNFLKDNYYISKGYISNNTSIDQLFYELERNTLGRNFIGNRKWIMILKNFGKRLPIL